MNYYVGSHILLLLWNIDTVVHWMCINLWLKTVPKNAPSTSVGQVKLQITIQIFSGFSVLRPSIRISTPLPHPPQGETEPHDLLSTTQTQNRQHSIHRRDRQTHRGRESHDSMQTRDKEGKRRGWIPWAKMIPIQTFGWGANSQKRQREVPGHPAERSLSEKRGEGGEN